MLDKGPATSDEIMRSGECVSQVRDLAQAIVRAVVNAQLAPERGPDAQGHAVTGIISFILGIINGFHLRRAADVPRIVALEVGQRAAVIRMSLFAHQTNHRPWCATATLIGFGLGIYGLDQPGKS